MPPILGRNHLGLRADRLGRDRIDREGVLAEHGIQARRQISARHQLKNVVGAVAQRHLIQLDAALLGQQGLECKTVAVRVASQLGQRVTDGCQRFRTGAQRVFVARQFDDAGRIQIQLASQFVHGFARNVRRKLLHARLCQSEEIATHLLPPLRELLSGRNPAL
ncbi:hypothetical protein D3C73_893400 [compost metagenome]